MSSKQEINSQMLSELETYLAESRAQQERYEQEQALKNQTAKVETGPELLLPAGWEVDSSHEVKVVRFKHYEPNEKSAQYYYFRNFLITDKSTQPDDFSFGAESGVVSFHARIDVQFLSRSPKNPEVHIKGLLKPLLVVHQSTGADMFVRQNGDLMIEPGQVVCLNNNVCFTLKIEWENKSENWILSLTRVTPKK